MIRDQYSEKPDEPYDSYYRRYGNDNPHETRSDRRQRNSVDYRGRGPRGWPSDNWIREEVCERLTQHPDIDASEIEVSVRGGEVSLKGKVVDRLIKRMAEDVASHVPGVLDVQNQLHPLHRHF